MTAPPIDRLMKLGFSEYEAKAYLALLQDSPVTGYQLSKSSGVPRSMIYEVLSKLVARGAAMTLRQEGSSKYTPVPADEFFDQLKRHHADLVDSLKDTLRTSSTNSAHEFVWNIEGSDNVMAKAGEMIGQARHRVYLALLPATFPGLSAALLDAISRGVSVAVYSTDSLELPGGRVVTSQVPERASERLEGLWLIMVADGREALIGELLTQNRARASWTRSPLFVFLAEHHLRTDLYLPKLLSLLGEDAVDLIDEADRDLFATALESRIEN